MKTLYLDCGMGASGDMLTSALLEIHPDAKAALARLNNLGLPGIKYQANSVQTCGISGTHTSVLVHGQEEDVEQESAGHSHSPVHPAGTAEHHHHHTHTSMQDIKQIVSHLDLPSCVKKDILAVYQLIAEAESTVHKVSVSEIHFHEVGSMDAVADVTAVCFLLHEIAPEKVLASPVRVGFGQVRCAHGIIPVPAPAAALLLTGVPTYAGDFTGEFCTPTGAALLKYFVSQFCGQPVMQVEKIGYGIGRKEFPAANCVRAFLGETESEENTVAELSCNLDDMTPEAIGFAEQSLLADGALDVFTVPIGMKKSRPGILLCCICQVSQIQQMVKNIFLYTTTLGIRERKCSRYTMKRELHTVPTSLGTVHLKTADGFGIQKEKLEYEDVSRIAHENKLSFLQVQKKLEKELDRKG